MGLFFLPKLSYSPLKPKSSRNWVFSENVSAEKASVEQYQLRGSHIDVHSVFYSRDTVCVTFPSWPCLQIFWPDIIQRCQWIIQGAKLTSGHFPHLKPAEMPWAQWKSNYFLQQERMIKIAPPPNLQSVQISWRRLNMFHNCFQVSGIEIVDP